MTKRKRLGRVNLKETPVSLAFFLTAATVILGFSPLAFCQQPNIVVIISDDAGYSDYGFSADAFGVTTDVRTPNLDALATQSVLLTSAYASGPVCSPARAGFLTGRYQQRIGYEDNPGAADGLPAGEQLLSHHLQGLGYTTGAIGKWHLGEIDNVNRPLDMGFDEFYGFLGGGRPFWGGYNDSSRQLRRGDVNIESQWPHEGNASRYDPVSGRYLTDAFGEEAVDFINRHSDDEDPFFLYVALNGPHTPFNAKQSDLDQFSDVADIGRRYIAAMTHSVDRAVGDIVSALATNEIDDNTIVVFMNDNGGPAPSVGPYNNAPWKGNKGSLWEGGIRVPVMIKAPDLAPGTYDEAIVTRDLVSTFINAAGGDAEQFDIDGTDLMPHLTDEVGGDPHELMFWRHIGGRFVVRKGDWKLVRPGTATFARLHNMVTDPQENAYVNNQYPDLVAEMFRELTFWEATLEKPKWGALGDPRNRFDHFVFRNDVASVSNWSTASVWKQAGTNNNVTFRDEDAYANAIIEFTVRNDADYTATNNMLRMTSNTFMLNEMRLSGNFGGASNRSGTLNGYAVLFATNLSGQLPRLRLDATSSGTGSKFTFAVNNELQLLNDLEITGNGTQDFVVGGAIKDYFQPRNVIKSGSSSVTLAGSNTFRGNLVVLEGRVTTSNLAGGLVNIGGTYAPGASAALTNIDGDFTQDSGTLALQIGGSVPGTGFDKLVVDGSALLGGTLDVKFINDFIPAIGQTFQLLTAAGGVTNAFDAFALPGLTSGMWMATYNATSVSLSVAMEGDFNLDGIVDAADYVAWRKGVGIFPESGYNVWRENFGDLAEGDFNQDGLVNAADYVAWAKGMAGVNLRAGYNNWGANFGQSNPAGAAGLYADSAHFPAVPEPGTATMILLGATLFCTRRNAYHRGTRN